METRTHIYKVEMTCDGCKNAVQKVLDRQKANGVKEITISLDDQTVKVSTTLPHEDIYEIIKKTGKSVEYITTQ